MSTRAAEPSADILVVDDERLSRAILVRTLEKAGHACRQAVGGRAALAAIAEQPPALVLLDYAMPDDLNGAEVCERLRADPDPTVAQIPVIMLTGMSGNEQEVLCLEAGASDFVTKPVNPAVLGARINTQLRLHALRRQLEGQNQELADWRADLERDLEAARATQQTIIPQTLPTLLGWDFAAHYQPVIQVGGDMYDWLRLPDGRLFFWIADATGHGASAALLTALAKLLFRHAAALSASPAEILRLVNADFRASFKGRSMLTAMGVALDTTAGTLTMAGAGHPPLIVTRRGGSLDTFASQCPPLGLQPDLTAGESEARLDIGDGFLLFTDGFYDVASPGGARMEFDTFAECVRSSADLPRRPGIASGWVNEVLDNLRRYADGQPFTDDLAAVAVFRQPGA